MDKSHPLEKILHKEIHNPAALNNLNKSSTGLNKRDGDGLICENCKFIWSFMSVRIKYLFKCLFNQTPVTKNNNSYIILYAVIFSEMVVVLWESQTVAHTHWFFSVAKKVIRFDSRPLVLSGWKAFTKWLFLGVMIFKDFCHWRHAVCCRNWHWDEPSCGYEVCVVMYHQPSAPPGLGGLYMFQWNDDNCETKNNFICKYSAGTADAAVQFSCALATAERWWLWLFSPQRNHRILRLLPTPLKQVKCAQCGI